MRKIIIDDKERVGAWVARRTGRNCAWGPFAAIGIEQDGELIGGFVIDNYVKDARATLHAAGVAGKWITRRLLRVVFDYVFRTLGCKVLVNAVNVSNAASMKGTADLGFTERLRIENGAADGALAVFVMQKHECPWLGQKRESAP